MKKYFRTVTTLLTVAVTLTASAYTYMVPPKVEPIKIGNGKMNETVVKILENGEAVAPGQYGKVEAVKRVATRANDDMVKLTCTLEGSTDGRYMPVALIAIHEDMGADTDVNGSGSSATLEIPAGIYDVIGLFMHVQDGDDSYRSPGVALVIRENVEVTDGVELTISADEATVLTKFTQEMPNGGEVLLPEVLEFDEYGDAVMNDDEDSYNIGAMYINSSYINKDGSSLTFENMATYRLWDGTSSERLSDFLCNPLSDEWTFVQQRFSGACFDFPFYAVMSTTQNKGSVKARGYEFTSYRDLLHAHTPLADAMTESWGIGRIMKILVNGRMLGGTTYKTGMGGPELEYPNWNVYGPDSSSSDDVWVSPLFYSYMWDINEIVGNDFVQGCIADPPMYFDNGVAKFALNGGELYDVDSNYDITPYLCRPDNEPAIYAPGHPLFSYDAADMSSAFGDSYPFLTTMNYDMSVFGDTDVPCINTKVWSLAQKGETRYSDLVNMKIDYYFNGEKVLENVNPKRIYGTLSSYVNAHPETGEWKMEITNKNHRVWIGGDDELEGVNKAEIYYDTQKEDNVPPTVRMIQMRDHQDEITERFSEAKNGTVYIAAADFEYVPDFIYYDSWSIPHEVELAVEYSPYGTDWFAPLEVNEMADMFAEVGLGHVYSIPLAGATQTSPNGWFDLRVTVTDKAGNYQQQVISPAFKIVELSGVAMIGEDASQIYTEGNNIIAPENAKVFSSNGMPSHRQNLQPGVYIVRTNDTVRKVVIR